MSVISKLWRGGRDGLAAEESGSATVETVLWIPIYILFFSLIVDASMLFNAQAHLTRLAQDANRAYSVGRLDDATATRDYILARIGNAYGKPRTEVNVTENMGVISTEIKVDAGLYMAVGFFDALDRIQLVVRSQQMREI